MVRCILFGGPLYAAVSAQTRPEIVPRLPNSPGLGQRDNASQEIIRQQERERRLRRQQERAPVVRLREARAAAAANQPACGRRRGLPSSGWSCGAGARSSSNGRWLPPRQPRDLGAPDAPQGRCLRTQTIGVLMGPAERHSLARRCRHACWLPCATWRGKAGLANPSGAGSTMAARARRAGCTAA